MENERINRVLESLKKSTFRASFHLKEKDKQYVKEKGIETIRKHAYDLISKRLDPGVILNDGRQTPMKGHPVFIAQHATATCCRGCLLEWHKIPKGMDFSEEQLEYVVNVIMKWIENELNSN